MTWPAALQGIQRTASRAMANGSMWPKTWRWNRRETSSGSGAWFVEQRAYRICVNVAPENIAARKVYRRCGAHREHVRQFPVVALGPEVKPRGGIDELRGHTDAASRASHNAIETVGKLARVLAAPDPTRGL